MSTPAAPVVTQDPSPDWRASLPEEMRAEKSFEKFKGVPDLAKSYVEIQKSMGNAIRIPKADADAKEWDAYYAKTGRPESPDKYEFTRPQVAEGAKYDETIEKEFKTWAHGEGLSTRQAQGLLNRFNEFQGKRMSEIAPKQEEAVAALKKEWGTSYDKNIGVALETIKENAGDGYKEFMNSTGIGNHPEQIKFIAAVGKKIADLNAKIGEFEAADRERGSENRLVLSDATGQTDNRDALLLQINEIRRDPAHPFNSKIDNEAHRAAMRQMNALYEQAYPKQS